MSKCIFLGIVYTGSRYRSEKRGVIGKLSLSVVRYGRKVLGTVKRRSRGSRCAPRPRIGEAITLGALGK